MQQLKKKFKNQQGMGLIEVLISVMVVAVVLTAVAILLAMSIKNTAEAAYREAASFKSQEVLEHLRKYRVIKGWNNFSSYLDLRGDSDEHFCLNSAIGVDDDEWIVAGSNPEACEYELDPEYKADMKRTLIVSYERSGSTITAVNAVVETSWLVGTKESTVRLEQKFTDYRQNF